MPGIGCRGFGTSRLLRQRHEAVSGKSTSRPGTCNNGRLIMRVGYRSTTELQPGQHVLTCVVLVRGFLSGVTFVPRTWRGFDDLYPWRLAANKEEAEGASNSQEKSNKGKRGFGTSGGRKKPSQVRP